MSTDNSLTLVSSDFKLGSPIPPLVPHAITASLPTWQDNIGFVGGEERVIDAMTLGYPRLFIHPSVTKLASMCQLTLGAKGERCFPFPSLKVAEHCREYVLNESSQVGSPATVRTAQYLFSPDDNMKLPDLELHLVFFPAEIWNIARMFWKHAGMIVSSRLAEHFLSLIPEAAELPKSPTPSLSLDSSDIGPKDPFVDERYVNKSPEVSGMFAKRTLRRRIGELFIRGPKGASSVTEDDVYLFPTGMSAIWNAHQLALGIRTQAKSVCFGFPFTDTLKVLQQWGPGCHFFGRTRDQDIDALERLLEAESRFSTSTLPAAAIFTEFPSNPLLSCTNLPRLRALADKYDVLLVIDDTIGSLVNVEVLPYADMVVTSLTKYFGGYGNVTGGSLVINPAGRHYAALKEHMSSLYHDIFYWEDAVTMEFNSRNYKKRVQIINKNAEAVCDLLLSRSIAGSKGPPFIEEVFYPKRITRENYDICRTKGSSSTDGMDEEGGFGGLMSIQLTSTSVASAFYDALPCYKGPTFGTSFTLACPYTILGHYKELEWAAECGIDENLVRLGVGMEDINIILRSIEVALDAAEAVC